MRWPFLVTLAAAAAATACGAHRPRPGDDEQRPVVVALRIEGTGGQVDPNTVAQGLATQVTGPFPWSAQERFDPVVFDADLRRIVTFYRQQGYYRAAIAESAVEPLPKNRVAIRIRVSEGPPTRIRRLEVSGLEELPEDVRDGLKAQLGLAVGDRFLAQQYEAARARLEQGLREAGFARAAVQGHVDVFPEEDAADVKIDADAGEVHRFGGIQIRGLHTVPESKVRAVARRAMPPGERITPVAIQRAQTTIYELGVFDAVRVTLPRAPGPNPAASEVVVTVQEAPAHAVSLGGGVAVDRSLQELQLIANYRNYNSLGSASRFTWNNALNLQFLPSLFNPTRAGLGAQSTLEFTVPEVLARTDAAVQVGYERVFRPAFQANAFSARFGAPIHPRPRFQIVPAVNFERYYGTVGRAIVGSPPPGLDTVCPEPCRVGYPSVDLSIDNRDDPIAPTRGSSLLFNVQLGTPALGSHFQYLRLLPEVRGYVPATERIVLAGRLRVGALYPLGAGAQSPIVQRFFGGGEGGHRGFGPDLQSPIVQDTTGAFVPVGGNGLWLATLEARARLSERWGLVVFTDYGDVTAQPLQFDFGEAPVAVGLGARYFTLAGPIRLDVAGRVEPRPRLSANTGARVDTRWFDYLTVFISLGESF